MTNTPRLALRPDEAAETLGLSRDSFDRHVRDQIRLIRVGRIVLVTVAELEKWLARNAGRTMADELGTR